MLRMVEIGRGLGLDVEPPDVGVGGEPAGKDHLQRDEAVQADLPGLVDDAHAAAGDLAHHLVIAEVADVGGLGCAGCGRWILPTHRGGGLFVRGSLRRVARQKVAPSQERPQDGSRFQARWSAPGDRGGIRSRPGIGFRGGPASRFATVCSEGCSSRSRASNSAAVRVGPRQARRPDSRRYAFDSLANLGLESPADLVNAAGQTQAQAAQVVAGLVAHLDSVRGVRSLIDATVPSRLIHE